ncbi:MAG TPA: carboxylate-amine ligase [Gammaproteobacteria bacterium]|jgi:carboxylate-amine ligase
MKEPPFTLGIEEEYLLVDPDTRDLVSSSSSALLDQCARRCEGQQVSPELLRSQIEVGTRICADVAEARTALIELRRAVVAVAAEHGLQLIAASTHPFARWSQQKYTEKARYAALSQEMQGAARRLLICGMHVHVGIDDDDLRIDLMNQYSYFLPHLLALSCSSPFWEGRVTGLKSYRLTVFDAVPRTGMPERFDSFADYKRHVDIMVNAGLIPDSTMIWWDVRPSGRYPTLETRIMDVCTSIDDALCLAAMVVCILRMLWRLRLGNQRWRIYTRLLLNENRWRAMRYSVDQGLIDLGRGRIIPFPQLMEELLELISDDAAALGCVKDVQRVRHILAHGTSAHRQLKVRERAIAEGASEEEALRAVVDSLVQETAAESAA